MSSNTSVHDLALQGQQRADSYPPGPSHIDDTERSPQTPPTPPYPDGGYGWVVVISCALLSALTSGWGTAFGVFQQYYAQHTYPHAPTGILALAGTLQYCSAGVVGFFSGRMGGRYSFQRVLFLGAAVLWVGIFTAAFSKSLWSTVLCQGFITGLGLGIALPLFMSLPSQWFYTHRGLASGMVTAGSGIGGGVFTLAVQSLLTQIGPRYTLLVMSFVVAGGMVVCISVLRERPTSPEAGRGGPMLNTTALRTPSFWSISLSLTVVCLGYPIPFIFITQFSSNLGISDTLAAVPLTVMSFASVPGRILIGYLADRVGPLNTYLIVVVGSGVLQLTLWLTASSFPQVMAFAVLYGMLAPGYAGLLPQIAVALFGPGELASSVGLLLLFQAPGQLTSGPLGGAVFDSSGRLSFQRVVVMGGCFQVAGGLVAVYARVCGGTVLSRV